MTTATDTIENLYTRADKDIAHYQRLLAGSMSDQERLKARKALIAAVFLRGWARRQMEELVEA